MSIITAGKRNQRRANSRLFQGVVRMSRIPNEMESITRNNKNPAVWAPWAVIITRPPICSRESPGTIKRCGQGHDGGERQKQQGPFDKKQKGDAPNNYQNQYQNENSGQNPKAAGQSGG